MRFFLLLLCASGTVAAGLWPFGRTEPPLAKPAPPPRPSLLQQPAPDYRFRALGAPEANQSPAAWLGRPVFLNFFASWCVPCRAEHPVITKLRGLTSAPVIGVGHMDRPEDTLKLLKQIGDPYTLLLEDKMGAGGKAWGVRGVPESFILDAKGIVVWNHRGPLTENMLQAEILPLLAQRQ